MFYLILPMLASAFIYIMALETGGYWGFLTYLSVGLLSRFCHAEQGRFTGIPVLFAFSPRKTAWNGSAGSFWFLFGWQSLMPQC
ncbi:MAG: hypothetical protein ACLSFT_10315 [Ruminococcus callidus]